MKKVLLPRDLVVPGTATGENRIHAGLLLDNTGPNREIHVHTCTSVPNMYNDPRAGHDLQDFMKRVTTHSYTQNMNALGLVVSVKKDTWRSHGGDPGASL